MHVNAALFTAAACEKELGDETKKRRIRACNA
jgi:hypothetical protein